MLNALAITGTVMLLAGGATLLGLIAWSALTPANTSAPWTPGELASLPPAQLRDACPICGGRHCAGCAEPARVTATATTHIPRHDFEEVPPSIRWFAERVHVTFRGTLISTELMGHHVWRPADGTAFRLWARRKLGRELQLGTFRRTAVLP